jgi:hypothetical protein
MDPSKIRNLAGIVCFVALTQISLTAGACRPAADQKYPTLEDNFRRAKSVYFATILNVSPAGKVSKLGLQVEKIFKGNAPKENAVLTNESSSCDRLAYGLAPGDGCILFELPDGKLITSMFDGESSLCIPKGAPRLKTLTSEFEAKFKFGDAKPKP